MNWSVKKFGILITSFLILGGGLAAALVLTQKRQVIEKKAAGENARLELLSNLSVTVGNQFNVPVMVNTDNVSVVAIDVVLRFDKNFLELTDITPYPQNSNLKTFLPVDENGNFQKQEVIDRANQTGIIEFGAAAFDWASESVLSGFNGILSAGNPLANLKFKALQSGQTTVSFDFTPGVTTDSNLVAEASANDILARVTNLSLTITGTSTPTNTPTPTSRPTNTPTPTPRPTATNTPTPTPTTPAACSKGSMGDLTCDGVINILDLTLLLGSWGPAPTPAPGKHSADIAPPGNLDNQVNILDLTRLLGNWGQ